MNQSPNIRYWFLGFFLMSCFVLVVFLPAKEAHAGTHFLLLQEDSSKARKEFEKARELFDKGKYHRARRMFRRVTRTAKSRSLKETAFYYWAEATYQANMYLDAHRAFKSFLEEYPRSEREKKVLRRQLDIGFKLVKGRDSRSLFGLPILPARRTGKKLIENILSTYPYQSFSAKYQYRYANYHFKSEQFRKAAQEYRLLLENYGDTRWAPRARFLLGVSNYRQFESVDYDVVVLEKARRQFRRYLKENPEGEHREKAEKYLRNITVLFAQKDYNTARFYRRVGQKDAATYYFREVLRRYPSTELAEKSLGALKEMEVEVKEELRKRVRKKRKQARNKNSK